MFKCRHCHRFVCPPASGSHHRNHCPFCLFSRHVDDRRPGDRMSACGSSMEAIGSFQRRKGEHVLVHRCLDCGLERFNRIAADDDFDLVLALPALPPLTSKEVKTQRLEEERGEEFDKHYIA
ncbi:MAG: RNHCP domain-containing protein [Ktedonobacteraceae bacterium]|nr:RNHCP domain-containing protein [Chloroflexota bacterium]